MSAPIVEPIAAIDSKIINKIVKAYQLKLNDSESRGVKRKRESDAAITDPQKKRKEVAEGDEDTSEYNRLMEDAKQLKHRGDKHKHSSEGVECYIHSTLTYARATLCAPHLDLAKRVLLYRSSAALLVHAVSVCLSRDDEQRAALCYLVLSFCYARIFMLQRDKCEHDVRHLSELTAGGTKTLSATLEDLFRCLELWDKARKYEAARGSAHPLDLHTSELIEHVTKRLEALKQ